MTSYAVKELFLTLQGEGAHTGRTAVFCRFSGCNLWSGREADRSVAICQFCDTDFTGTDGSGGGIFDSAAALAKAIANSWGEHQDNRFIVFTGGEPLLQLDEALLAAVHDLGFETAVETNGTLLPPKGIDWLCISPKAGAPFVLTAGDELKLVFPQRDLMPDSIGDLGFKHFWLQPMDGPGIAAHTQEAIAYCLKHPRWRLSLQTHKFTGIP